MIECFQIFVTNEYPVEIVKVDVKVPKWFEEAYIAILTQTSVPLPYCLGAFYRECVITTQLQEYTKKDVRYIPKRKKKK